MAELDIPATCKLVTPTTTSGLSSTKPPAPNFVVIGNVVVIGDEDAPVVARVIDILDRPGGRMVLMALVAGADELAVALSRARFSAS